MINRAQSPSNLARGTRPLGMLLIILASASFSLQMPLLVLGTANGITSVQFIYLATMVASVMLIPLVPSALRNRPTWLSIVVLSLARAIAICGYFIALHKLPPSLAVMFFFTGPLMVLVQTSLLKLERVSVGQIIAFFIAIGGLVLALDPKLELDMLGIAWAIIGGFGMSWEYLAARIWLAKQHAFSATVLSIVGTNFFIIPFAVYSGEYSLVQVNTDWIFVVLLAVIGIIVPTLLLLKGIVAAGANTASLLALSEPVFTIAIAIGLGWDDPNLRTWLGMSLLLAALTIIVKKPNEDIIEGNQQSNSKDGKSYGQ